MKTKRVFLDTNLVLYTVSGDPKKSERARKLLSEGGVVSVQVLHEFIDVGRRKFKLPWDRLVPALESIRFFCEVVPITLETHILALDLAQSRNFRIYDASIIATAQRTGCNTLLTEDLSHGERFGDLVIRNPFAKE